MRVSIPVAVPHRLKTPLEFKAFPGETVHDPAVGAGIPFFYEVEFGKLSSSPHEDPRMALIRCAAAGGLKE
jgi:hypothetical protein